MMVDLPYGRVQELAINLLSSWIDDRNGMIPDSTVLCLLFEIGPLVLVLVRSAIIDH